MSTVDESRPPVEPPGSVLEFETLLAEVSSRFINLAPGEVDREIEDALRHVCQLLGVDLAVLWQWSAVTPAVITPTHAYYAHEGLRPAEPLREDLFPWVRQQMLAGQVVVFPSVEDMPVEAAIDRDTARRLGIRSTLILPLSVGAEPPVGALGFNTVGAPRDWPDAVVKRLQLAAQVFTNALARRRHEVRLQESEERLTLAADSAEAGLWTLDYATGVFWATERARAIFGYSPEQTIDMVLFEASVHPGDWTPVREAIERSARAGEPIHLEYRITRASDSRLRWIVSRGRPHVGSSGMAESLMGVSVDVTERKVAEESLRLSEARLAAGADLAGLGFFEVDWAAGTMFVDDRFREICGAPPDRQDFQILEFWKERLHADDAPQVLDERRKALDGTQEEFHLDYRYLHPARGERWLQHIGRAAARDAAGRVVRSYGVLWDITERRQREEALRQSYAEIKRLKDRLQVESDYLKAEIGEISARGEVTGRSVAIQQVLRQVEQVAPTDASVLVRGETGSGKELVAQAIHRLSPRQRNVLVKVNCAALPSGLVESELFGREKGAYTGALTRQVGRFEIADGSSIFLDEVGELSLEVQAKLLRVLEAGEFERLGSPRTIKVNVRVIAATNRDLVDAIKHGRFREDLYYRLNVFPIRVPPLRERAEDIPLLVWTFLRDLNARMGKKITQVPRKTMEALQQYGWPGNVRELRNVIEHGAIITIGDTLRLPVLGEGAPAASPPQTMAEAEREHILQTLERTGWHIKGPGGAAAALGLNPSTLRSRMKKLGIQPRPHPSAPA